MEKDLIKQEESSGNPVPKINWAKTVADELVKIVESANMAKSFGGAKKHLEYEAWMFIAAMDGTTPSIGNIEPIEGGFLAHAELRKNNEIIAQAQASCSSKDEKNWQGKPEYAIRSMAQTRALSKVCRVKYAWIARLGGYSPTPAEEMSSEFTNKKSKTPPGYSKGKGKNGQQGASSKADEGGEPPEKPETGDEGQNDHPRPIGEYPLLFTVIPNQVIGTGLDDVPKLLPQLLTADQANRILLVVKKKAIDRDEFILKVAEICKKKE